MGKKRIIAGVTACILIFSIAAGVTAMLDRNYDERLISSDSSSFPDSDSEPADTQSQKVKKAFQSV